MAQDIYPLGYGYSSGCRINIGLTRAGYLSGSRLGRPIAGTCDGTSTRWC